ncbi:hypothetical protein FNW02_37680 [Komarekiella sp. 'clone 1']|uniref:Uncharacterized protein n=1 Tax=Komarekiella delphini-convector SJRDD-AB1 TaxID=2593771 RepID=A0AA40VVV5_9NOST|nr:hypothetical protein [Komarekiella delphini-convector SJRDD-AB1]
MCLFFVSCNKAFLEQKIIESNPTLKARVISALKAGGTEAFKELIDNPLINILLASIDGWQEAE